MRQKNKHNKRHTQSKLLNPRVFLLWALSPFLILFIIMILQQYSIVKDGIQTDACVYKKTHARAGKRSSVYTYCQFEYNGLQYTADVRNHYKIGDSIQVLFLPQKPTWVVECDGVVRHWPVFKRRVKKGEIVLKEQNNHGGRLKMVGLFYMCARLR